MTEFFSAIAATLRARDGLGEVSRCVPANSHATVYLPGATLGQVREGSSPLGSTAGIRESTQVGDAVRVELGSGNYEFAYERPTLKSSSGSSNERLRDPAH